MGQRLYVKNIPWETTEDALSQHFEQCGQVNSVTIIKDRDTGRSKGFCFVEMESGAQDAIDTLNGIEFEGRVLMVNKARPKENRGSGNRRQHGNRGNNRGGGNYRDRY